MRAADIFREPIIQESIKRSRRLINPPYKHKDIFIIVGVLIVLLAIPLTVILVKEAREITPRAKTSQDFEKEIVEKQTLKLLSLNSDLEKATKTRKGQILKQMTSVAKTRKNRLSSMVEKDPQEVLKVSLPPKLKKKLPKEVQVNVEEQVSLEGILEVFVEDDFTNQRADYQHFLQTKKGRFSLHSPESLPPGSSGTSVRIRGTAVGKKIVLDSKIRPNPKVLAAEDTTGVQNNVVILVNFQNDTTEYFTPETAAGRIFTNSDSVNNFYQEASYGKVSLTGNVFGWYTLPIDKTCNTSTIRTESIQAADPDVNFQNYTGIIFAFPANNCGFSGRASIGRVNISTNDGIVRVRNAWIVDQYFGLKVVSHEIGHGFGAWHANAYECGGQAIGENCSSVEYGDLFDVMGSSSGHFSAYHKERFSWFDTANIVTVTGSGTFSIEPFETATAGPKIIKVPRDRDVGDNPTTWHYLEYRQPIGFDNALIGNVYQGALVHYAPKWNSNGHSQLIDTIPATATKTDAALTIGKTFSDSAVGVSIQTTNKTPSRLDIAVTIGPIPCNRADPTIAINPTQVFATSGSTETFTVTITNNDNSVCGPSAFSLVPTVPIGWPAILGANQLTINPGEAGATTLDVTSAMSANDGFYDITATATNTADTGFSASNTATYVVFSDVEDPTASLTVTPNLGINLAKLKAYYKFDETSGDLKNRATEIGSAESLGSSADGAVTGATQGSTGIINYGYLFDDLNDFAEAGTSKSQWNFMHNTSAKFTINLWMKLTSIDSGKRYGLVADVNDVSQSDIGFYLAFDDRGNLNADHRLNFEIVRGSDPTVAGLVTSNGFYPKDTGYHMVTVTYDQSLASDNLRIIMDADFNNAETNTKFQWSPEDLDSTFTLHIGSLPTGVDSLDGNMDELSIWNRVLSDNEISTMYNNDKGLELPGLTVSGIVSIAATATDNIGVAKVEFYVDGSLKSTDTVSPYSYSWDTTTVSNGSHTIQAKAYDGANNVGTDSITVTVDNAPATPGDLNGDGKVNIFDASIMTSKWGTNDPTADLNGDGTVNIFDASILTANWTG